MDIDGHINNHVDASMKITELYIQKDFAPINEANFKLLDYMFGKNENFITRP